MLVRAALAVTLGLVAAACGGSSKPPSVASLNAKPSSTSGTKPSQKPSFRAFAACMTGHGVPTETPGGHGVIIESDAAQSQVDAALTACHELEPGGGPPPLTPSQQARRTQQLYVFAKCMRTHGVPDFPDPDSTGELPFDKLGALGAESAHLYRANVACRALFPHIGPQIRLSPAPTP